MQKNARKKSITVKRRSKLIIKNFKLIISSKISKKQRILWLRPKNEINFCIILNDF